jgi:tetratricopeptide (TPR) repeat protein
VRGYWTEGRERLESLLSLGEAPEGAGKPGGIGIVPDGGPTPRTSGGAGTLDLAARARALDGAGVLAHTQGNYPAARAYLEDSLAIRRELRIRGAPGSPQGLADSLNLRGLLALDEKEDEAAQKLLEDAMGLLSERDHLRRGKVLHNLALAASRRGSRQEAQGLYEAALQQRRAAGDLRGEAETLANLGVLAHPPASRVPAGDLSAARRLYLDSLSLRRTLGDRHGIATMLNNLAELAEAQADVERAVSLFSAAERIFRELGSTHVAVPAEALQRLARSVEPERWTELHTKSQSTTWEELLERWQG